MFSFSKVKGHAMRVRTGVIRHWKVWERGWAMAQEFEYRTNGSTAYSHVWYVKDDVRFFAPFDFERVRSAVESGTAESGALAPHPR